MGKKQKAVHAAASDDAGPSVLLLGEANFSFALSLATLLEPLQLAPLASAAEIAAAGQKEKQQLEVAAGYLQLPLEDCRRVHIVATCYEDSEELVAKYPEASGILAKLQRPGSRVQVCYGVNGWDIGASFSEGRQWDIIAWNHPHLGTEDFRLHRFLLAHFCAAAAGALRDGGRVVLSLVEGQESRWSLLEQASRHGLCLLSSPVPFAAADYPGYECKRNSSGRSFKNLHSQRAASVTMRSWTYHLGLGPGTTAASGLRRPVSAAGDGDADPTSCRPAKALECSTCGKRFSCAQGLKTHVRQVHELKKYGEKWKAAEKPQETCKECGRSFCDAEALRQHIVAAHSRGAGLVQRGGLQESTGYGYRSCEICGMALPLGMSMAAHLEALKPLVSLPMSCACGRGFTDQRALEQHARFCPEAILAAERPQSLLAVMGKLCSSCCAGSPHAQRAQCSSKKTS
eukprot:TRINITY_DN80875_c0_g1_i1.p1 TRINITY_DN80875_c0_g1~~TRINITY_DN80875_c0_g1_i1.p1  ORF type:complete len:458 (+),score=100.62 TRINITY_DN80875_c0_g1_i1:46-1419(+)